MASYRGFRCESCGAMLHMRGNREYTYCEYCGAQNFPDRNMHGGYSRDYDRSDDEYDEDRGYRDSYDREIELEKMRMEERESIRDNKMIIGAFALLGIMWIFGSIFGL